MLAARNRLTSPDQFREVVRRGHRVGGPLLVVHLLDRPARTPGGGPRAGLVVSRAVGPAVTRNLVKRRLRQLLRGQLRTLPDSSMLVLRALPASATASYAELEAELTRCLSRLVRSVDRPVRTSVDR